MGSRSAAGLALSLSAMSPGRAPDLWAELRSPQWARQGGGAGGGAGTGAAAGRLPVLLVTGQRDGKFVAAARKMAAAAEESGHFVVHSAEARS